MEISERISLAKDILKEKLDISYKSLAEHTLHLKNIRSYQDQNFKAISQGDLSRASSPMNSLGKNKQKRILNTLEIILRDFTGYVFKNGKYVPDESITVRKLPQLPNQQQKQNFDLSAIGVNNGLDFSEVLHQFEEAKEVIIIQSFLPETREIARYLKKAIHNRLKKIRILLVKPLSPAAHLRANALGHWPDSFDKLITSSLFFSIIKMYNDNEKLKDILEIRFYEDSPVTSLYGYKDKNDIFHYHLGLFWANSPAIDGPFFRIRKEDKEAFLPLHIEQHIETLWKSSEENIVPLDRDHFNLLEQKFEAKSQTRNLFPSLIKAEKKFFFKCFYWRENKIEAFLLSIDISNQRSQITKTTSGSVYKGLYQKLGSSSNIIAQIVDHATPRSIYILAYSGVSELINNKHTIALYSNISQRDALPYSNLMILVKLDGVEQYESTQLKNKVQIVKYLKDNVINVGSRLVNEMKEALI